MGDVGKIKCLRRAASLPRFAELGRWAAERLETERVPPQTG
jgi:hypothetical protein